MNYHKMYSTNNSNYNKTFHKTAVVVEDKKPIYSYTPIEQKDYPVMSCDLSGTICGNPTIIQQDSGLRWL